MRNILLPWIFRGCSLFDFGFLKLEFRKTGLCSDRMLLVRISFRTAPVKCWIHNVFKGRSSSKKFLYTFEFVVGYKRSNFPSRLNSASIDLITRCSSTERLLFSLSGLFEQFYQRGRSLVIVIQRDGLMWACTPARFSKSVIRLDLMLRSMGESQFRLGDRLTSSSHGFISSSISMSKPSNSKQLSLYGTYISNPAVTVLSIDIIVFIIISLILSHSSKSLTWFSLKNSLSAFRLHLLPSPSPSTSIFSLNYEECLLIL